MSLPHSRILLVEDEPTHASALMYFLEHEDYTLFHAFTLGEARAILEEHSIDLILLDLYLPDGFGIDMLAELPQRFHQPPKTIVISSHNDPQTSALTIKMNAYDYFQKPAKKEIVREKVREALEDRHLEQRIQEPSSQGDFVVGQSPKMHQALTMVNRLAPTDIPILLMGESGAGKEHFARMIHDLSPRAKKGPLVIADCTALPKDLVENELFGNVKGAFTDANGKQGLVGQADGGTLFLDEIHHLPYESQVKLLRLLSAGTYRPLGSTAEKKANVRIVCATNRDLTTEVTAGRFAPDLFYRIKGAVVMIPPLRERKMDLDELIAEFITRNNRKHGRTIKGLKPDVRGLFHEYSWQGNVRELAQAVELAVVMCDSDWIGIAHCPYELQTLAIQQSRPRRLFDKLYQSPKPNDLQHEMDRLAESMLRTAMAKSNGNVSQAAKALGVSRDQVRYMMKKFNMDADDFKDDTAPENSL